MTEAVIFTLNIFVLFALSYWFYKTQTFELKSIYWPTLLLKLAAGILYGLLYLYYYKSGDTIGYFYQGIKIADLAIEDFPSYLEFLFLNEHYDLFQIAYSPVFQARAFWMTKAISPLLIITGENYWLTSCYLSLASFFGIFFLSETLVRVYPKEKTAILLSFFLFPTFVFWSTGLSKESVAVSALFFLIAVAFKLSQSLKMSWQQLILVPICLWIEWKVRFFYLAVFLLTIGLASMYLFLRKKFKLSLVQGVMLLLLSAVVLIYGLSRMEYALHFSNFLDTLVDSSRDQYASNPSNAIQFHDLNANISSILINSPIALISGLFRPSVFDAGYLGMFMVGLENLVLLLLLVTRIRKLNYKKLEIGIWAYILLLATFLALSSPNFGSLTRYKVGFLPFFLFLLLKEHPLLFKAGEFFKKLKSKN